MKKWVIIGVALFAAILVGLSMEADRNYRMAHQWDPPLGAVFIARLDDIYVYELPGGGIWHIKRQLGGVYD
jgi:hypothetical protein